MRMPGRGSEFTGSLFERVAEAMKPPSYKNQKEALLRSIRLNLLNILNTRTGSCQGSPELGIPDFNDAKSSLTSIRDMIAQAISHCVLHYEPRISDATVTAAASDEYAPLELRFHIVAYIDFSDIKDVFECDILLDNHQHWRME